MTTLWDRIHRKVWKTWMGDRPPLGAFEVSIEERCDGVDDSEIGQLFFGNQQSSVTKWHHYLPIYDKLFSRFQNKELRFLEIGVLNGGSLRMWRKFFGPSATLFGIDINPECARFNGQHGEFGSGRKMIRGFFAQ